MKKSEKLFSLVVNKVRDLLVQDVQLAGLANSGKHTRLLIVKLFVHGNLFCIVAPMLKSLFWLFGLYVYPDIHTKKLTVLETIRLVSYIRKPIGGRIKIFFNVACSIPKLVKGIL